MIQCNGVESTYRKGSARQRASAGCTERRWFICVSLAMIFTVMVASAGIYFGCKSNATCFWADALALDADQTRSCFTFESKQDLVSLMNPNKIVFHSLPSDGVSASCKKLNPACSFSTVTQGVKLAGVALGMAGGKYLAAAAARMMMMTMITASKVVTKTV